MGEHVFLIVIIAIIVLIQLSIWVRTYSIIQKYIYALKGIHFATAKAYIPDSEISRISVDELSAEIYQTQDDDEEEVEITYICLESAPNGVPSLLQKIINAINAYLLKNQGAASDFNLIKDIVERYCNAKREEVETQLPMPLYLGLMGTMIGIIVGIGAIAIGNGGFKVFIDKPEDAIGALMGGVAIAMIASLLGILLTTIGSWLAKNASSQVEQDKNEFYSWIQAELLPVLGGTENSLVRLQENLLKFNRSFSANTTKLDKALQKVEDSYESQIKLMRTIQQLDIRKMATANVSVLRELQAYTPQLERFSQYLSNVNEYISHVNTLNDSINSQMNRTQLIERMGTFFEQEVKDIEQRKAVLSEAVGKVDDRLQQTLHALQEHADESMQSMNEALVRKQDIFNRALDEQQEAFKRKIQENGNLLDELKKLEDVASAIHVQSEKLDAELESLNMMRDKMEKMAMSQDRKMDDLIAAVENMSVEVKMPTGNPSMSIPKLIKCLFVAFISLGTVVLLMLLIDFIIMIARNVL